MNVFDAAIIHFLNAFAQRSLVFDSLIVYVSETSVLKGGIIVALFWWAWFRRDDSKSDTKEVLLFGLFTSASAILVARLLALRLPFRIRPIHNSLLNFTVPHGLDPGILIDWSAFPSDHAVLYFSLATTLWFVSRRLGAIAFCHAFLVISLPRVYLGIHYPTDMVAGALLGTAMACTVLVVPVRRTATRPLLYWLRYHPASFCAFIFLASYELTEHFEAPRQLGFLIVRYAPDVLHALW